jgi:multicomponent Na+:H+ antiporter subunit D
MGRADADLGDRAYSQALVTHRDHLHIGGTTVPQRDQDEARSIVDEGDETSRSLYQLSQAGALPARLPRTMVGATAVLIALSLALTVVAGPVMGFADRAARDVLGRDGYVSAVLPDGVR